MKPLIGAIRWLGRVVGYGAYRFYWDDCFSRAAALAYTTLFALVPITAIGLSMFQRFGIQQDKLSELLLTILKQVLPSVENAQLQDFHTQVLYNLQTFAGNVAALNSVSIGALVFSGIALLNTIESALNIIWRVTSNLSLLSKVISFWAVITLGPLLIAVSIYYTTMVSSFAQSHSIATSHFRAIFDVVFPLVISWAALTLLYYKLPAAKVRLFDASLGGLLAAALFEFVKRGFAYYVGVSTGYSTIYGAVAVVPLFVFWLYVAWAVVLYGAEVACQAGNIKIMRILRRYSTELGEVAGILGVRILSLIGKNHQSGFPPLSEGDIAAQTGVDPVQVRAVLDLLTGANIITPADPTGHTLVLMVSPDRLKIKDILLTFRSRGYRTANGATAGSSSGPNPTQGEQNEGGEAAAEASVLTVSNSGKAGAFRGEWKIADEELEQLQAGGFLETFRRAGLELSDLPVGEWTLKQLISIP